MAQQLRQAGQEVGLLVLIDPTPPHLSIAAGPETPANSAESFEAPQARLSKLSQLGPNALVRVLWASLKWRSESFIELLKLQLCHAYLRFGRQIPSELRMPYFFEAIGRASEKYRAKPYPGRVVLLSAQAGGMGSHKVWRELATDGLETHELPGGHLDVIKAHKWRGGGSSCDPVSLRLFHITKHSFFCLMAFHAC